MGLAEVFGSVRGSLSEHRTAVRNWWRRLERRLVRRVEAWVMKGHH